MASRTICPSWQTFEYLLSSTRISRHCLPSGGSVSIRRLSTTFLKSVSARTMNSNFEKQRFRTPATRRATPNVKNTQKQHDYQEYVNSYLSRTVSHFRTVALDKVEMPDLNTFVKAAEACGFLGNKGKVFRDCVVSLTSSWDPAFEDWKWVKKWALDSTTFSAEDIYHAGIVYLTAVPMDPAQDNSTQTLTMVLFYTAYKISHFKGILMTLGHLFVLNGQSPGKSTVFPDIRADWRALLEIFHPDACTIEAKHVLGTTEDLTEAKSLLETAIASTQFHFRPMALVLLGRVYVEEDQLQKASKLFTECIQKYQYGPAYDEVENLVQKKTPSTTPGEAGLGTIHDTPGLLELALQGQIDGLRALRKMFIKGALTDKTEEGSGFYAQAAAAVKHIRRTL